MTIEQSQKYIELIQQGVPAADAFKQAYPKGLPTAADKAKEASKQKQKDSLAGIGGTVAGLASAKAGMDAVSGTGWFAKTGGEKVLESALGGSSGSGAIGAPNVISATRIPGATAVEAPGMFSVGNIGAAGNMILPAVGAFGAYDLFTNDRGPVGGALQGAASGAAIGAGFGGVGAVPGALIGGGIGLVKGLSEHESTRDHAKKNTKKLMGASDDPTYQSYVQGMREQYNSDPTDPSKPFAGKYASWDEYKKGGLEANDLTGVYGNLKTFGADWAKLPQAERVAVTQGLIDKGLYDSKKGEVIITNPDEAKKVYSTILKPTTSSAPAVNPKLQEAMNKQNAKAKIDIANQIYR